MGTFHSNARPYKCAICQALFKTSTALKSHAGSHHQPAKYKCPQCAKCFTTAYVQKLHTARIHNADYRPVACEVCETAFKTTVERRLHQTLILQTSSSLTHKCDECRQILKTLLTLREHKSTKHSDTCKRRCVCSICECAFPSFATLEKHKKAVHCKEADLPTLACRMCGKAFKSKCVLRSHITKNHAEKSFKCEKCVYETSTAYQVLCFAHFIR